MQYRLRGLLVKEFVQFFRDPVMLTVILYFYTACIVICAYALTFEVKDLRVAVIDFDRTPASRTLINRVIATNVFELSETPPSVEEAVSYLQRGHVMLALVIPSRFQEHLAQAQATRLQILIDGTNSNIASQARASMLAVVTRFEADLPQRTAGGSVVRPEIRVWYNPDLSYSNFIVISMIAIAALIVGVIHPAASFAREKEIGTIEQLRVTPVGVVELFIGKTMPTLAMGLLSLFPSLAIAALFGVPFQGSIAFLLVSTLAFLLSAISIGVLIAAFSNTMQQALLLGFFGLFPMMFLSGTIVPIESMPDFLQTLSQLSPLRHYLEALLMLSFKGAGAPDLLSQTTALFAIGAPLIAAAVWFFRRSLI